MQVTSSQIPLIRATQASAESAHNCTGVCSRKQWAPPCPRPGLILGLVRGQIQLGPRGNQYAGNPPLAPIFSQNQQHGLAMFQDKRTELRILGFDQRGDICHPTNRADIEPWARYFGHRFRRQIGSINIGNVWSKKLGERSTLIVERGDDAPYLGAFGCVIRPRGISQHQRQTGNHSHTVIIAPHAGDWNLFRPFLAIIPSNPLTKGDIVVPGEK